MVVSPESGEGLMLHNHVTPLMLRSCTVQLKQAARWTRHVLRTSCRACFVHLRTCTGRSVYIETSRWA